MKKYTVITIIIFILVTSLCLLSNFILWDETPLEQTIFALPLAIGMLLQVPFSTIFSPLLLLESIWNFPDVSLSLILIPFLAGGFYAALYHHLSILILKYFKKSLS